MKPLSDDKLFKLLRDEIKKNEDYNNKFLEARRLQKQYEQERETVADKFKRQQKKEMDATEKLRNYLANIKE